MEKYLEVGKIVTTHGVKGDVKVIPWCDTANFICNFETLYTKNGESSFKVIRARVLGNMAILRFEGIDNPNKADTLRQTVLYINRDDAELPEGSYFVADLIGLEVYDEQGKCYGKIKDVLKTGANDVYEIIDAGSKLYYIPAIPDVVLNTDIESGRMTIHPMEGLFDAN
ncbi:MAG: ribosome maturation factor RimM [Oscillospiraceae bacterium]|nr:ribosome maturation factor RimM [Oscillospiraceae bacterium]